MQLSDHAKLPYVTVQKSNTPFLYHDGLLSSQNDAVQWLNNNLEHSLTAAFLVIRNDTVLYEKYFSPYTKSSLLPSFSVVKSFIGTLTGIAIEEGKIKSLEDPITDYLPKLLKSDAKFSEITIKDLLDMRSGIQWKEGGYGMKDNSIMMAFRSNIEKQVYKLKIAEHPVSKMRYQSINTLLLGMAITKATGKPLVDYFYEKIWNPIGAENGATLNTDKKKHPITYGGLNATARDFARLGTLYLKNGTISNHHVVGNDWVQSTINKDSMKHYHGYHNQWWSKQMPVYAFYAKGIWGQMVYVMPSKNLVIVRLGRNWSHPNFYLDSFILNAAEKF